MFDPVCDVKPMYLFQKKSDMVMFSHPHQDPGNTVVNVPQFLDVLVWDAEKECIAIVHK